MSVLIRGVRLYGEGDRVDVLASDGQIADIGANLTAPDDADVFDATDQVLLPGFVDMHTHLREPGREYADYRTLLQAFALDTPAVLVSRDGQSAWSLEPRFYDVSVVLPPTRLVAGRPDWLALGGAREAIAVALDLQPESLPCAIEARYAGEGDAAIPADRLLVEQGGGPVVLFLRPGEYRIAAVTATGRVFGTQRLRVAPGDGNARIPSSDASR